MQLFYSRRIGLDAPILAAAKVTGTGWKGLDVGILDAVVMGAGNPGKKDVAYLDDPDPDDAWIHQVEGTPDRRLQFHLQQPFHLGLNSALPREPPVSRNYFAAVARQTFLGNSSVGLTVTSVNPLQPRCTHADIERTREMQRRAPAGVQENTADPIRWDETPSGHTTARASAGPPPGLDFNLRSHDGEWVALGTVLGSRRIGGPAGRRAPRWDGHAPRRSLQPADTSSRARSAAKASAPSLNGRDASPKLDLTAIGYQQSQNQQAIQRDPSPITGATTSGRFHELQIKRLRQHLLVDRRALDPAGELRRLRGLGHPPRLPAGRLER